MQKSPAIRFRIDFAEDSHIGPGKISLLEAIRVHGSISAAARAMQLSYRRAWQLLENLNQTFTEPVSLNSTGGVGGGGVKLTPFGELLIERYREIETRFAAIADRTLRDIQARVKPGTTSQRRVPVKKSWDKN